MAVACVGEPEVCEHELDVFCEGTCPTLAEVEASCSPTTTTGYTEPLLTVESPECSGFDARLCTGTNITAELFLFDGGGTLYAAATQSCGSPDPKDERSCDDRGGWTYHGPADPAAEDCVAATGHGLYCYE